MYNKFVVYSEESGNKRNLRRNEKKDVEVELPNGKQTSKISRKKNQLNEVEKQPLSK